MLNNGLNLMIFDELIDNLCLEFGQMIMGTTPGIAAGVVSIFPVLLRPRIGREKPLIDFSCQRSYSQAHARMILS